MSLTEKEMYQFGPFSLDPAERVISRDGTPFPLTPKAFDTLVCLVRHRGRLLTKDELLKEIWPDTFVEEVNLAKGVFLLRKTAFLGETDRALDWLRKGIENRDLFIVNMKYEPTFAPIRNNP